MEHARSFATVEPKEAGVVASSAYLAGRRVADIGIEEAEEWSRKAGHVVWIGLHEPSRELLIRVQRQLHLHDLAVEDAEHPHQHPKLEQYGDALFIVARTAQLADGRVAFGETHLFVGKGYIVSIRHGASTSYAAVRRHWESCPAVLAKGEDFILYAILDFIVDNYPLVEVCRRLTSAELPQISPAMHVHFRDVTDHIRTVQEKIDSLREVLAFAFEANILVGQGQENAIAKKLASWAAILAVPTAIAGIYGMNFEDMPELRTSLGYPGVLVFMASVCAFLYWRFRKNGWL
jgi:magnesium transporter